MGPQRTSLRQLHAVWVNHDSGRPTRAGIGTKEWLKNYWRSVSMSSMTRHNKDEGFPTASPSLMRAQGLFERTADPKRTTNLTNQYTAVSH